MPSMHVLSPSANRLLNSCGTQARVPGADSVICEMLHSQGTLFLFRLSIQHTRLASADTVGAFLWGWELINSRFLKRKAAESIRCIG